MNLEGGNTNAGYLRNAITAAAGLDLARNAGLQFGYEFLRAGRPGEVIDTELAKEEGWFARLQLRF